MDYVLDLKGKSLGRSASEAVMILRGKRNADFAPNLVPDITLKVINAAKLDIKDKKKEGKIYTRYSGYPGGLKKTRMKDLMVKDEREAFRKAVRGMLPKNKLRSRLIKNLIIEK